MRLLIAVFVPKTWRHSVNPGRLQRFYASTRLASFGWPDLVQRFMHSVST